MAFNNGLGVGTYESRDIVHAEILTVEPIRVGIYNSVVVNAIFPQSGFNEIRRTDAPPGSPIKTIDIIVPPFDWYRGPSWFVQMWLPDTTITNTWNVFMPNALTSMQYRGWGFFGFLFNPKQEDPATPGVIYNVTDILTPDDINFRVTPGGWLPIISPWAT